MNDTINHVIGEVGPLSNSALVRVLLYDGTLISCRASLAFMGQTEGQLDSVMSGGSRQAWISALVVMDPKEIEYLIWPDGDRCRVLDRDSKGNTIRLQLQEPVA